MAFYSFPTQQQQHTSHSFISPEHILPFYEFYLDVLLSKDSQQGLVPRVFKVSEDRLSSGF